MGGFGEGGFGDIDGLVDDASLLADGSAEEDAGLGGGAGTEFDEGQRTLGLEGIWRQQAWAMISSAWAVKISRSVRVR